MDSSVISEILLMFIAGLFVGLAATSIIYRFIVNPLIGTIIILIIVFVLATGIDFNLFSEMQSNLSDFIRRHGLAVAAFILGVIIVFRNRIETWNRRREQRHEERMVRRGR